ncbi:hypothetical protein DL89DRAFT_264538 [Linderina pennispora]|uniref:Nuclear rim protein 1 n=1 Tax=Linderina pennispora TaxID=61395 RepID=A0A1Y1WMN2_9FUNG|nr:uncharacterized protein DL89DRAFT_264538 [Linderina pennispora]ORX74732.1 hypothetical protein DL89DRAFT_264538 [Linderina pennispora]
MANIRKKKVSLWERLKEGPRDWLLHLAEDYEIIDWDKYFGYTVEHEVLIDTTDRYRTTIRSGSKDYWDDAPVASESDRTWYGILVLLQLMLFGVSMANAWRLFTTRRTYQLLMKDLSARNLTSSCRRMTMGTERPAWALKLWGRPVWYIWKKIMGIDDTVFGEIWEMSMWTPTTFSRNMFCWASPLQLLVLTFLDWSSWYYILPLAAGIAVQSTYLVMAYTTLVKDKQIVSGEVHDEYNFKFVYPHLFAPKRDAATSTLEDYVMAREYHRSMQPQYYMDDDSSYHRHTSTESMGRRSYLSRGVPRRSYRSDSRSRSSMASERSAASDSRERRFPMRRSAATQRSSMASQTDDFSSFAPLGAFKPRDRSVRRWRTDDSGQESEHFFR